MPLTHWFVNKLPLRRRLLAQLAPLARVATLALLCGTLALSTLGCATRQQIADEYEPQTLKLPSQTMIFFLVDGLSIRALKRGFAAHQLPNIEKFFHADEHFYQAHSAFPSLTYTNISSLLTEQPVSSTGFLGNKFFLEGHSYNFEVPTERKRFGALISHVPNIFHRLEQKSEASVSLDYGLGVSATVHAPIEDASTVLELAEGNYLYADQKKIEALQILLEQNEPAQWPGFLFIHLVGLDFISHANGPDSAEAIEYLQQLDESLEPLLNTIRSKEYGTRQNIISVMSADHGFIRKTHKVIELNELIEKTDKNITVLNESRMAALFWTRKQPASQKTLNALFHHDGVEILAQRTALGFTAESNKEKIEVELRTDNNCQPDRISLKLNNTNWQCASQLDAKSNSLFYPFFVSNLAYYFAAKNAPNAVLIPNPDTTFTHDYAGNHGGPTEDETLIPLLMRNASLNASQAPPIWHLLNLL